MSDTDQDNVTMMQVCRNGNAEVLLKMIKSGNSLNVRDNRGWYPIHQAAYSSHVDCLKILLEQDAVDANWRCYEDKTPLYVAASNGCKDCVQLLLANNGDPKLCDNFENTALHKAVENNQLECARLLLDSSADSCINAQNFNKSAPIHIASQQSNSVMVQLLVDFNCQLDITDEVSLTPVFIAAHFNHKECLEILIDAARRLSCLSQLIDKPAEDGATPLYISAQEGNTECVRLLLDNGANPHCRIEDDVALLSLGCKLYMPLHAAVCGGHYECIKMLFEVTETIEIKETYENILLVAYDADRQEGRRHFAMDLLLELGVDPWTLIDFNYEYGYMFWYLIGLANNLYTRFCFRYNRKPLLVLALQDGSVRAAKTLVKYAKHCNPRGYTEFSPSVNCQDECPVVFFSKLFWGENLEILKTMLKSGLIIDYYLPQTRIKGNLTLILSLSNPYMMLNLLKAGAEVESIFKSTGDPMSYGKDISIRNILNAPYYRNHHQATADNQDIPWWTPGAAVRLLMEFCRNVTLDPGIETAVEQQEWRKLQQINGTPRCLQHLVRLTVRQCLGTLRLRNDEHVKTLNIPKTCHSYILYQHLDYNELKKLAVGI